MSTLPANIELTLVSHTNAGKTTLARTLLGRDIGEVRDAPHVTDSAQSHVLIDNAIGDVLRLCDTPGFGDSIRLVKRLRIADNPIGWLLHEVWDRYRNRPLWCSQQAVQAVRASADVVLYIVNAAEDPRDATYVQPEMQILSWIGKPVLLLLNQTGPPRIASVERSDEERWRASVAEFPIVRDVLSLDAFARCWVQEHTLLQRVATVLPAEKRAAFDRLGDAWRHRSNERFQQSMAVLAQQLMNTAIDIETTAATTAPSRGVRVLKALGIGADVGEAARARAMTALAARADAGIRSSTDRLIALHDLRGAAAATVLERLRTHYAVTTPVPEGKAAAIGGIVSGALSGLIADLASGGLSLGAGIIAGSVVGALGGAGLARGHNFIRGVDRTSVGWSPQFLNGLVRSALLRYLAVAHFGRGRGDYAEGEAPAFWQDAVEQVFAARSALFDALWENAPNADDRQYFETDLRDVLTAAASALLEQLYPDAWQSMAALARRDADVTQSARDDDGASDRR